MIYHYIIRLFIILLFILIYYKYIKSYLIFISPKLTLFFRLNRFFPVDDIKGVLELALIASTHVLFCWLLWVVLPVHLPQIHFNLLDNLFFCFYGILLGIGCMGVAGLFCKTAVYVIHLFQTHQSYDLKSWLTVSRGGWIKHHLQSMEILPIYLSLLILTMQVGSEEIIFRGIIFHYFLSFGVITAFGTSVTLFVIMQAFLMYKWEAAIFPMIGATVIGVVHSLLYLQIPVLWPLVLAHVSFFLFSVI